MALPVRDFVIQRLLEYDPSFDAGAGVATTGLMIDPLSVILQPIIDELTIVQISQSILSILETDDPDSFPEDIVDGLASNVYVERNPGEISSDVQRIRFFEPIDFSAQKGVLVFRGAGGQRYTNSESVTVTSAEVSLNQEGTLFFVDIPIIALEEGDDFNVAAGSITVMESEPIGTANVANLFGMEQGRNRETNTELIDRIKVAVTVRALVTGRGIIVTLTETFTTIVEITPIGFGDDEMMRDIVFNVHIGGNIDVYIKTPDFTEASFDVFGLEIDTTRQKAANSTATLFVVDQAYSLSRAPVDRTNVDPVVKRVDGGVVYTEGALDDYVIDDANGNIARTASSTIVHLAIFNGDIAVDQKTLTKVGAFTDALPGMTITITTPGSVAGKYSIKEKLSDDSIKIYGLFAVGSLVGVVDFTVDEVLSISFEYNPVTIDVIKESRSAARDLFTIVDVPFMLIDSVEVLDPLSGEPTGELLDSIGGYGSGGYGLGGYGVGGGADFKLVVTIPTFRHSELEDNYIEFSSTHLGRSVRVNYQHASAIPPIQAFMDDRDEQNQCASLIARHYIPIYIDSTKAIIYDIDVADEIGAISVDEMLVIVDDFVDGVDEGADLQASDLVDVLYDNGAVRVDLGTMESLRGEVHNHDGSVIFALPASDGSISIPDDPIPDPTDKPLSTRIARFRARGISLTRNVV